MKHDTHHSSDVGERDYEDRDIPISKIVIIGIYTAIFAALSFFAMRFVFNKNDERITHNLGVPSEMATERVVPNKPLLQINEQQNWRRELAQQEEKISNYKWIDKQAGVVEIPVDRAIELIAQKGLPARGANGQ